ncbi:MAG: hypothetical protein AAGB31_14610 [Bdellovibrio sp.]
MRKSFLILSTFLLFILNACSAVPVKYSDGFTEEKSSAGVYRVQFTGNGTTSADSAEKMLLRRCAELTQKEGYDHFTFYTKSRSDKVTYDSNVSVPRFYGVIHMHKGAVDEGYNVQNILAEPLPTDIQE